jgi:putative transposase
LDESHLWAAVRYVELNPVRAGLVSDATDYPWSSARAHAGLATPEFLDPNRPFPGPIADWAAWLRIGLDEDTIEKLRRNTAAGMPTGNEEFVAAIETRLRKTARAGRPRKANPASKTV